MGKGRLEAFSDGVIAILITIMVLELKGNILSKALIARHGAQSSLATALGRDVKGQISMAIYALGIGVAFWSPWLAFGLYALVALLWLVPDRRIERTLR